MLATAAICRRMTWATAHERRRQTSRKQTESFGDPMRKHDSEYQGWRKKANLGRGKNRECGGKEPKVWKGRSESGLFDRLDDSGARILTTVQPRNTLHIPNKTTKHRLL